MGWWTQDREGHSFGEGGGLWGDGPADIFSEAVGKIVQEFEDGQGRLPTKGELRRGLEFIIRACDDLDDPEVEEC